MKFWTLATSLSLFLLILSGCGSTPKPADKESAVIDASLPIVTLTKNGSIVGMKSIAFEWESITDPKVQGVYVYKKTPTEEGISKLVYYTTINSRFATHFVDTDVQPGTRYTYSFKTFTKDAEGANGKEVVLNTLPVLTSVSWIHSITGMPRIAKIIWRPHSNGRVKAYVMERKTLEDEKWRKIDTIEGRLNAEYIDEELKDNFVYMYRVRALTYDGITSTPSQIVKVVTKELPKPITNLSATTNKPNKINLTWDKSVQKDFALYYLYRSEGMDSSYELIAKLHNNLFTDKIQENGKIYFYRVSATDTDALESISTQTTTQGKTLNAPEAPAIVEAKRNGSSIEIHWSKTDPRSVSYILSRSHKKGWFDTTTKDFKGLTASEFTDENIEAESTYSYVVYSVDVNGIKSDESVKVKIVTPDVIEGAKAKEIEVEEVSAVKESVAKEETVVSPSGDLDLSAL